MSEKLLNVHDILVDFKPNNTHKPDKLQEGESEPCGPWYPEQSGVLWCEHWGNKSPRLTKDETAQKIYNTRSGLSSLQDSDSTQSSEFSNGYILEML